MNAVNAMADVQTGQAAALPERQLCEPTEPKFTATQIEKDRTARLQEIGREIMERIEEAREQTKRLDDHVIAINKLLVEAKSLCDAGGFKKFRELFCPQLGKTQSYALHAIGAGKATLAEHRTAERDRKRKTRAHHKAAASTFPGQSRNLAPEAEAQLPEPQDVPTDTGVVEHHTSPIDQRPVPSRPWKASATVEGMRVFTVHTLELYKSTDKRPPEYFSATSISVEILEHLGNLFTGLAKLQSAKAASTLAIVPGSATRPEHADD